MLPNTPEAITAEWLRHAMPDDLAPQRIADVRAETIGFGEGFAGRLARVEVTTTDGSPFPSLVAKFPAEHATTRELLVEFGGYEHEVNFYTLIAPHIDLPTPRCYFGEYEPDTGSFLLILEDLAPAAVGDQVVGATLEQAELVLDQLARHHARWWNTEELTAHEWLTPPKGFAESALWLFDRGMPPLREQWGADRPHLVALVERTRDLLPNLLRRLEPGVPPKPYTLVHGDMRLDNLFFPSEEGGEFSVIDWQGAALGPAVNDLVYWLILSLPIEVRRTHEDVLLRRYHAGLVRHGVTDFSLRQLRRAFREGTIQLIAGIPILAGSLDFTSERGVALAAASLDRLEAALEDHEAERMLRLLPWVLRAVDAWQAVRSPFARLRPRTRA